MLLQDAAWLHHMNSNDDNPQALANIPTSWHDVQIHCQGKWLPALFTSFEIASDFWGWKVLGSIIWPGGAEGCHYVKLVKNLIWWCCGSLVVRQTAEAVVPGSQRKKLWGEAVSMCSEFSVKSQARKRTSTRVKLEKKKDKEKRQQKYLG